MAPLVLYYWPTSTVARAALMTIKNLEDKVGEYEVKIVNLFKGEQYEEWYKKINPQSAVPVIDDNGFILNESRAIAAYLVNSRDYGNSLYPSDAKKRAIVDARLYFEATLIFPVAFKFFTSTFFRGNTDTNEFKEGTSKAFGLLNQYLTGHKWVAGEDVTIADFFFCADVTTYAALKFPLEKYPEIKRWYEQCKSLPGFVENEEGAVRLGEAISTKLTVDWD